MREMNSMKLCIATVFVFNAIGALAEVQPVGEPSAPGDSIGRESMVLLSDGRIALKEVRSLDARTLAKRCDCGVRVVSDPAFGEPHSFVMLFGYKSHAKLRGIEEIAWREYFYEDSIALTLNRVTKFIPVLERKKLEATIRSSDLWKIVDQDEIPDFKFSVADGYQLTVQLFHKGKLKELSYSNPESYPQPENRTFLVQLGRLLADLGSSPDGLICVQHADRAAAPACDHPDGSPRHAGLDCRGEPD
jgi:hypothetical protein